MKEIIQRYPKVALCTESGVKATLACFKVCIQRLISPFTPVLRNKALKWKMQLPSLSVTNCLYRIKLILEHRALRCKLGNAMNSKCYIFKINFCTIWVASPSGFSEMTIQPARRECHACCPPQAEKPGIQPVVGNTHGTHVKQVVSSFQKILRGPQLTWYHYRVVKYRVRNVIGPVSWVLLNFLFFSSLRICFVFLAPKNKFFKFWTA